MKALDEGHMYQLNNFDNDTTYQTLRFIHKAPNLDKDGEPDGTLHLIYDGTTNEEVLAMLIDRMQYLQGKFPCRENAIVITKLEESLMWLNKRTQDRINRGVEGKHLK